MTMAMQYGEEDYGDELAQAIDFMDDQEMDDIQAKLEMEVWY